MMDIFNVLGGMGQAQQTVGQHLGLGPQQSETALETAIPLLLGAITRNAQNPQGAQALAGALNEHDGGALDRFQQGQAPNLQDGHAILGHVFGGQQQAAAQAVSRRAGIDPQLAMQVLSMAAPLVLAYLSRRRQGQNANMGGGTGGLGGIDIGSILGGVLGSGGLGSILGGGQPQAQTQPQGGVLGGGSVLPGDRQRTGDQSRYGQNPLGQPGHTGTGQMGEQGGGGLIGTLNRALDHDGDGNALNDLIGMFGGRRR